MKINLNLLKIWFEENIDIENIITTLTNIGFESFTEKNILNISIPNNRPNCTNLLSILDELSKFYKIKKINDNNIINNKVTTDIKLIIKEKEFCPIYCYTIIKNINNNLETPKDIAEHLDLNDIKKHDFITDLVNFSTLITGQPLHAYDKNKIGNKIIISRSKENIKINSINNIDINIKKNDFVIYNNNNKIISIPGKIGTFYSKIDKTSTSILVESAYFNENNFKFSDINTTSSNIFKHGINLQLIKTSLTYLINLITQFQQSNYNEIIEKKYIKYIPKKIKIVLKKSYLLNFAGLDETTLDLDTIFKNTGITVNTFKNSWTFKVPSHRKDINIKENILAEIIKFFGYNKIKETPIRNDIININKDYYRKKNNENKTINFLLSHGFNEVITYSFVDKNIENLITEDENIINIKNPMSENNNVLRSSLIQGLVKAFKLNVNRGYEKIKLFEVGNIYIKNKNKITTINRLACICEENDIINENKNYKCNINFFIIKKLIENIITNIYKNTQLEFKINTNSKNYLDTNISADITIKDKKIGEIGLINENFLNKLSIKNKAYFCQIDLNFKTHNKVEAKNISKFPKIKRDISIITGNDESYSNLKTYITLLKIKDLKEIKFMNVFHIENNNKSINIRLTFQNNNKTLTDYEINSKTFFIIDSMKKKIKLI